MTDHISVLLQNSVHQSDAQLRRQADDQLQHLQHSNYSQFLFQLATLLGTPEAPSELRQLAGLVLRNTLTSHDSQRKAELQQKWLAIDDQVKDSIRKLFLQTLDSPTSAISNAASLCIGKIGSIDIPQNHWPDLLSTLSYAALSGGSVAYQAVALDSIGYLFEEFDADYEVQQEHLNFVLTAIVGNMRSEVQEVKSLLSATTAMQYVVEYASVNFGQDEERLVIMAAVLKACTYSGSADVQYAGFECLIRIAQSFYEYLPQYVPEIYRVSSEIASNLETEERVSLQALEFWCTLCEEEQERNELVLQGYEYQIHNIIQQVAPQLTGLLTELLLRQEEGQEDDPHQWNISLAAATCLSLLGNVIEDRVVELVSAFITNYLPSEDWRYREAATVALGAIMEGPSPSALTSLCKESLPLIIKGLSCDEEVLLRSTSIWTIGRILEFGTGFEERQECVTGITFSDEDFQLLAAQLLSSLSSKELCVVEKACYAIANLTNYFEEGYLSVSTYFQQICAGLLMVSERGGDDLIQVSLPVYDCLIRVVQTAPFDVMRYVGELVSVITSKIEQTLQVQCSNSQNTGVFEQQRVLQGSLCGVLQEVIMKLADVPTGQTYLNEQCQRIMQVLFQVMRQQQNTIHEEAMMAMDALFLFSKEIASHYLDQVMNPFVLLGIEKHEESQAANTTIGVFGDICRQVGPQINPYCDRVMTLFCHQLQSQNVKQTLKPSILSAIGQLALSLGDEFARFVENVLNIFQGAIQVSVQLQEQQDTEDEEYAEYNDSLRQSILEATAGMLQGLSVGVVNQTLTSNYVPYVIQYIRMIEQDQSRSGTVASMAVTVLGDIANRVANCGTLFQGENAGWIAGLLEGVGEEQSEVVQWATEQIVRVQAVA